MTQARPPAILFSCPACGAELVPTEGVAYITCTFCGTTGFVDLAGVLQHLHAQVRLGEHEIHRILRTHGAEDTTQMELRYHPFWEFTSRTHAIAIDAAPDTAPQVDLLVLPTGVRERWDGEAGAPVHDPTLVPEAAAVIASERLHGTMTARDATLVHYPLYRIVSRTDEVYWIDGIEGTILAGSPSEAAPGRDDSRELILLIGGAAVAALVLPLPAAAAAAILFAAAPSLIQLGRV